jgi:NADH-quinone oxidoreductase subunit L
VVVRPAQWFGSFAQQTFERIVVNGVLVGGSTGVVRAGSSAVRAAQTGFLRYYAALMVAAIVVIAFYFLLVS